ncbi:Hypothetical predicted protein [Marmota monax]|uniref:EF-hand domain-containing protein n=1 Tax=Marmota monax TaxID=9995 RepID=A0A5E4CIS8_MARMO|nr:Hypothetical predicted protein [Marmota monax]
MAEVMTLVSFPMTWLTFISNSLWTQEVDLNKIPGLATETIHSPRNSPLVPISLVPGFSHLLQGISEALKLRLKGVQNFIETDKEGNGILRRRDIKNALYGFDIPLTPREFEKLWQRKGRGVSGPVSVSLILIYHGKSCGQASLQDWEEPEYPNQHGWTHRSAGPGSREFKPILSPFSEVSPVRRLPPAPRPELQAVLPLVFLRDVPVSHIRSGRRCTKQFLSWFSSHLLTVDAECG